MELLDFAALGNLTLELFPNLGPFDRGCFVPLFHTPSADMGTCQTRIASRENTWP